MRYNPFYFRIATQQPWPGHDSHSWALYPMLPAFSCYFIAWAFYSSNHKSSYVWKCQVYIDMSSPLQQMLAVSLSPLEFQLSVPQLPAYIADTSSVGPMLSHAAFSLCSAGVDEILQWLLKGPSAHKGPYRKGPSHEGPLQCPQVLGQLQRLAYVTPLNHLIIASHHHMMPADELTGLGIR